MCGITGILEQKAAGELGAIVRRMTDRLIHRGPDGGDISALIGRTGVPTGTAADIQNLKSGFYGKPVKFDGDHQGPPGRQPLFFLQLFPR